MYQFNPLNVSCRYNLGCLIHKGSKCCINISINSFKLHKIVEDVKQFMKQYATKLML